MFLTNKNVRLRLMLTFLNVRSTSLVENKLKKYDGNAVPDRGLAFVSRGISALGKRREKCGGAGKYYTEKIY